MHERISISAVSSWGADLDDDLALWDRIGAHTVGLSATKLRPHGLLAGARRVRDAGLAVSNFLVMGPFTLGEPDRWPEQRAVLLEAVEVAAAVDAGCLVTTTGSIGALRWEQAAERYAEAIAPVAAAARNAGLPLALENTSQYRMEMSFVSTLTDTVDLAEELDVAVCVELSSCWAERGLAATLARAGQRLALVQLSDYDLGCSCTGDRLALGDGDLPLERLLGEILAAPYDGPLDVELIGPRIDAEGYEPPLRRSVAVLEGLLARLGA